MQCKLKIQTLQTETLFFYVSFTNFVSDDATTTQADVDSKKSTVLKYIFKVSVLYLSIIIFHSTTFL